MATITGEDAIDALKLAIQKKSDELGSDAAEYVYEPEEPVYAHQGGPSCLVGYALHYGFGFPVPYLEALTSLRVDEIALPNGYHMEYGALMVFNEAQELQDASIPWGEAVENADRQLQEGSKKHLSVVLR